MRTQKHGLTGRKSKGIVRLKSVFMKKPDERKEPPNKPNGELTSEMIRQERLRRREEEPGVKTGKMLGEHLGKSRLLVLPIQMALAPVLVTLGGLWLDRRVGSFPAFTIIGLAFGLTVAVRAVIHSIKEVQD